MITSRKFVLGVAMALGVAAGAVGLTPANAAEQSVEGNSSQILVTDDFDISKGVAVVDANGTTTETIHGGSRLHACEIWRNFAMIPGPYKNSLAGCALIGANKNAIVTYSWERTAGSGSAIVQGKGFNALHSPVWQNAGQGTKGSTSILWGNVASNKQIRGYASRNFAGVNWR